MLERLRQAWRETAEERAREKAAEEHVYELTEEAVMLVHPLAGLEDDTGLAEWTSTHDLADDGELERFLREKVVAVVRTRLDPSEIAAGVTALREILSSDSFDSAEWLDRFLIPVAALGGDGDRFLRAVVDLYEETA